MVTPTFAFSSNSTIDEALLDRGIPQNVLSRMGEDTKEHIFSHPELEYGSSICLNYNEETGEYYNPSAISPHGHIPDDDLNLTFSFLMNTNGGEIQIVEVTFDYEWDNLPIFRWTDPIGVSWDDELLRFIPESFHKRDYIQFRDTDSGILLTPTLKEESFSPTSSSDAGISWEAQLGSNSPILTTVALYGNAVFELEPQPDMRPMTEIDTVIHAKYVHNQATIGLGIVIPKYGTITVTGNGLHDDMSATAYIRESL